MTPKYLEIRYNFLISNYGSGFGVDNDDTSSYYKIHHNFFYLGGGVKCDYDGHEKHFYNNVMLGTSAGCWHTCAYKKGFPDYCHDNRLVQVRHTYSLPSHFATQAIKSSLSRQGASRNGIVPPFAIIWFCDAKNVTHILPDYDNEVQMGLYIHHNVCTSTPLSVCACARVRACAWSDRLAWTRSAGYLQRSGARDSHVRLLWPRQ